MKNEENLVELGKLFASIKKRAQFLYDEDLVADVKKAEKILERMGVKVPEPKVETGATHLHLCMKCWCMTKTIDGRCGKCGAERKEK